MRLYHPVAALLVAAALAAPSAHAMPEIGPRVSAAGDAGSVHDPSGGIRQLPYPPTWPANPRPIVAVPADTARTDTGDGLPWEAIALGLAGAALVLSAIGLLAGARRRGHRVAA